MKDTIPNISPNGPEITEDFDWPENPTEEDFDRKFKMVWNKYGELVMVEVKQK